MFTFLSLSQVNADIPAIEKAIQASGSKVRTNSFFLNPSNIQRTGQNLCVLWRRTYWQERGGGWVSSKLINYGSLAVGWIQIQLWKLYKYNCDISTNTCCLYEKAWGLSFFQINYGSLDWLLDGYCLQPRESDAARYKSFISTCSTVFHVTIKYKFQLPTLNTQKKRFDAPL